MSWNSERGGELEDMRIDEKWGLDHRGICGHDKDFAFTQGDVV